MAARVDVQQHPRQRAPLAPAPMRPRPAPPRDQARRLQGALHPAVTQRQVMVLAPDNSWKCCTLQSAIRRRGTAAARPRASPPAPASGSGLAAGGRTAHRSRPISNRSRHRRMDRSEIPRISAACHQDTCPLTARRRTSCTFIARSTAASGYVPIVPPGSHPSRPWTGHFTYYLPRTVHVLPTVRDKRTPCSRVRGCTIRAFLAAKMEIPANFV